MPFSKVRFLLLAFMLLLNANGLENSFNPEVQNQPLLQKLNKTVPNLVSDSSLAPHPEKEVKVITLAKTLALANKKRKISSY
ncbi:hypothetical protein [Adhaeribacter radiodurans]|uniref:Uncharacterized protein n=1 Tax=Adhaeribacter radiodurans TaxID=2745197 RepID=A0A7L7L4Q7_9BACT|nr:hypothetical protein [Adhaeribacter radiodurans]QMU27801.1 hypothetical protein HUW48_06960 [Adhaeribacter radiodurans]